jgi:lysophospholipase L1-like esterase
VNAPIEQLDENFAATGAGDGLSWYDARRLRVEGRGWADTERFFDRFPARARKQVPAPVWDLSRHSAGIAVRFVTASPVIAARWRSWGSRLAMTHMPATGVSGLDLYARLDGRWRWVATGRPGETTEHGQTLLTGMDGGGEREYRLYLSLYNGVDHLEIGVSEGEPLAVPSALPGKPICFYGTSIVQGGCASRPGMAYPAIVSRRLDRLHWNFGFSGNGRMEAAVAGLLAELDPALYVLDAFPNMPPDLIRERLEPCIRILRKAHPTVPIVVVENIVYQNARVLPDRRRMYEAKNEITRRVVDELVSDGVKGLTLVPGAGLLGDDGEATVDGTHPTDVGFLRIADVLTPVLRRLLSA